jgi:predicted alpha/beta-fold hydrolase
MKEPINMGGGHLETIIPYYLRIAPQIAYRRERIETPDSDFLDLDWAQHGSSKLILLTHGFESNTNAKYIRGMAKHFYNKDYDILAWNFRSCSGQINRQPIFYHSGATYDLSTVIKYALKQNYSEINLIGFSMGGNLTLKYIGENSHHLAHQIKKVCVFSVPCSLQSSSRTLGQGFSKRYSQMFLKSLKEKIKIKEKELRKLNINIEKAYKATTLIEFDESITAPLHGFKNALDYYEQSSANKFIPMIKIPTLIVNALNDPFLGEKCYPYQQVNKNKNVTLLTPQHGGHVGFSTLPPFSNPWSEFIASEFIRSMNHLLKEE